MILGQPDAITDPHDRDQDLQAVYHGMAIETAIIHTVTSVAMNHDDRQLYSMDARDLSLLALVLPHLQGGVSVDLAARSMRAWKRYP